MKKMPNQTSTNISEEVQPDSGREITAASEQEDECADVVDVLQIRMGGKDFLLPVLNVEEVVRPISLTPVPMAPDHLLGIGNIRGRIVCVVEPGKILDLPEPPAKDGEDTRFVCLRHARMHVAIRVDAVPAIHRLIKDALPHAGAADADHAPGKVTVDGVDYDMLDIAALLHE